MDPINKIGDDMTSDEIGLCILIISFSPIIIKGIIEKVNERD